MSFLIGFVVSFLIAVGFIVAMICSKSMGLFIGGSVVGFIVSAIGGLYFILKDMVIGWRSVLYVNMNLKKIC